MCYFKDSVIGQDILLDLKATKVTLHFKRDPCSPRDTRADH